MPEQLPTRVKTLWEHALVAKGLGGIAATADHVFVSDRELMDSIDVFKCLSAKDGSEVWAMRFPCKGELDFGASPRATPLLHDGRAFFFGAFGHLHAVEIATGNILWQMDVREEFAADDERKWGMCSSPLIVNGNLIVNPGAKKASLVALEPKTGKVVWKTPGAPASYGSFVAGTFGGVSQIIGYDLTTLGGWDASSGKRLWSLTPPRANDFNVPTPVPYGEHVVITTENNGTRLYRFNQRGIIDPKPVASHADLAPDSHTPVVVGDRLFGIWNRLFCLNLKDGLKTVWEDEDQAFAMYCSVVTDGQRLLVTTLEGELLLIDAGADKYRLLGRLKILAGERGVYSHPAFVGTRMYLRGNSTIVAVQL